MFDTVENLATKYLDGSENVRGWSKQTMKFRVYAWIKKGLVQSRKEGKVTVIDEDEFVKLLSTSKKAAQTPLTPKNTTSSDEEKIIKSLVDDICGQINALQDAKQGIKESSLSSLKFKNIEKADGETYETLVTQTEEVPDNLFDRPAGDSTTKFVNGTIKKLTKSELRNIL